MTPLPKQDCRACEAILESEECGERAIKPLGTRCSYPAAPRMGTGTSMLGASGGHGQTAGTGLRSVRAPRTSQLSRPVCEVERVLPRLVGRALHTLQKPSASTCFETDPCFVSVFHTLN